MKISGVKVYLCEGHPNRLRWVFVHVETDTGVTGLGDATNWRHREVLARTTESFKDLVLGESPFDIEKLYNQMYWSLVQFGPEASYLGHRGHGDRLLGHHRQVENGYLIPPDRPGIAAALNRQAPEERPGECVADARETETRRGPNAYVRIRELISRRRFVRRDASINGKDGGGRAQ